jgi:PAS domain S-box-containing protein
VDPRQYNRLLVRLLALPVLSLAVLALILGFGLQDVQRSARLVDHSDLVVGHANHLMKLIVDEETGLRGYLLTRDPIFLQPFHDADQQLDPEFATLDDLIRQRPDQVARLQSLEAAQQQWEQKAYAEIKTPPSPSEIEGHMLDRKRSMDSLRAQVNDFVHAEEVLRASRSTVANRIGRSTMIGLIALAAFVATFLVWETRRLFHQLAVIYNRQLEEVRFRAAESYAREQWLNTTIRSIGDAVIACDTDGDISFMNRVAEQLTGWTEAEAKGVSLHDVFRIFNEDTRAVVENPVDKVRRLGTVVGLANHTFLIAKDGREVCIDDSGAPIRDSEGRMIGIVLVFRNITERRVSESALMRAEKLATAGRMAASVAHEVNNPLEGLTNLVYIARHSDDMVEIRQLLIQAESELGRIAHITRQSLGFYRETSTPAHFKPATIVREVTDFYSSRALSQGVTFAVKTTTEMEVLGISGELRQILSNLLANGLDACLRGATIRVEANAATDPRNPGRAGVRISVADTGCGIRSDHIGSIFEPFFTTKKDTGTGLGLWVSRELVEKHGGSLRVRSSTSNGKSGTVFSIFLPAQGRPSMIVPDSPIDSVSLVNLASREQTKATLSNGLSLQ